MSDHGEAANSIWNLAYDVRIWLSQCTHVLQLPLYVSFIWWSSLSRWHPTFIPSLFHKHHVVTYWSTYVLGDKHKSDQRLKPGNNNASCLVDRYDRSSRTHGDLRNDEAGSGIDEDADSCHQIILFHYYSTYLQSSVMYILGNLVSHRAPLARCY